jgi:hypothetical protein
VIGRVSVGLKEREVYNESVKTKVNVRVKGKEKAGDRSGRKDSDGKEKRSNRSQRAPGRNMQEHRWLNLGNGGRSTTWKLDQRRASERGRHDRQHHVCATACLMRVHPALPTTKDILSH